MCSSRSSATARRARRCCAQPVDGVFFTGSYATGAKIAASAGRRMIKVQLELGGKDPVYVCDDVDVASAAAGMADGAFYNTGQSCCSVERIYVHEPSTTRSSRRSSQEVRGYRIGDPTDEATYIGPITRRPQLDVLERQVADARQARRPAAAGGRVIKGKGNWFEPTVFADVDHRMALMREESFGPIIGIQKVAGDDEAVACMNDTEYGLTAGVYTHDAKRAKAHPAPGRRRLGVLELLRPREPAAAVVGRGALGHRADAVDLRDPDVHANEGVALAGVTIETTAHTAVTLCHCPCSSAACSVFRSSMAMVIGPTPPGTGVIHAARSAAAA